MSQQKNLVSMVITEQDEAECKHAIERIAAALRGLRSLGPEHRRLKRMSPVEEARARGIIRTLVQNPDMVPRGLDVAGALADIEALERLVRIDDDLQRLAALVRDTRTALGIDIMGVASVGYTMSKTFGNALGIGDLVKEFGARFNGGRKKAKVEPTPESEE